MSNPLISGFVLFVPIVSPKEWVKDIDVLYGNSSGDFSGQHTLREDINKGFQGKYVWIKPVFTTRRSEAATRFKLLIDMFPSPYSDLAKGTGGSYRYLIPANDVHVDRKITRIWLSGSQEGDGYTGDINRGRGGRYLYLNWSLD